MFLLVKTTLQASEFSRASVCHAFVSGRAKVLSGKLKLELEPPLEVNVLLLDRWEILVQKCLGKKWESILESYDPASSASVEYAPDLRSVQFSANITRFPFRRVQGCSSGGVLWCGDL